MKKVTISILIMILLLSSVNTAQMASDSVYCNRLFYTAKVWGYLKYFHSEVAKGDFNWDEELFEVLQKIKNDSTNIQFNHTLMSLINKAGDCSYQNTSLPIVPDSLRYNLDLGWHQNSIFSDSVRTMLNSMSTNFRPQKNCYICDDYSTGNWPFEFDKEYYEWGVNEYPSEELRILALFRYWNIINYFFPYKNLMDQNWNSILVEFLPKVINATNKTEYHLTIIELTTRLNDSHTAIYSKEIDANIFGKYYLPIQLKYIEDKTVVASILLDDTELELGDVILNVNGTDIDELRKSLKKTVRGSTPARINYYLNERIIRGVNKDVNLIVTNESGIRGVKLKRDLSSTMYNKLKSGSEDVWKIIDTAGKKFGYVDMGALIKSNIDTMFKDLWNTDAIVFDIRNYPNRTLWDMLKYLYNRKINVANFTFPNFSFPGVFYWQKEYIGKNHNNEIYTNPIIILFDENTQSQAEYTVMAFEQHPKAIKIGSQTSGADGNISKIYLPGGIYTYFTGLGVYYPDYSQTQRIGIIPDIEVYPTIQGIRERRDEVLETAFNCNFTNVQKEGDEQLQNRFTLHQNYPNPFNPSTTIKYLIPNVASDFSLSNITLRIFDILGREVTTLVNQKQKPGNYEVSWDASNQPSGVYFYQLNAGNYQGAKKMLLLK